MLILLKQDIKHAQFNRQRSESLEKGAIKMHILNAFIIYLVLGAVPPSKSLYNALCNGDVPQTASWGY